MKIIMLSSTCGHHFDKECQACTGAKESNDYRLRKLDLYEAALREIEKGSIGAASDWSAEECADYWAKQALRCRSLARTALNSTDTGA